MNWVSGLSDKLNQCGVSRLRWVILCIVFFFVWTMMSHKKHSGSGDEPHYMMIAHSLAFDQDLEISNNYNDRSNLVYDGNLLLSDAHGDKGRSGHLYPNHDIGMPLLFAPYFALSYWTSEKVFNWIPVKLLESFRMNSWTLLRLLLGLAMVVLTGILAGTIFEVAFHLSEKKLSSFYFVLLATLSPPLLSYSHLFFTEICSALLAFYIYKQIKIGDILSQWNYFLLGFLAGYLFLVHIRNVGLVAALLVLALLKIVKRPKVIGFLIGGFVVAFSLRTAVNFYLWENWMVSAAAGWKTSYDGFYRVLTEPAGRLFRWIFDVEFGLWRFAPIYCLSFAGFFKAYQKAPATFFELLFLSVAYLLPATLPNTVTPGWSPAGRFLVPIIPFIILGTTFYFHGREKISIFIKVLIMLQVSLNLYFWQFPQKLWLNWM